MANEERVVNKRIELDTILRLAEYLEKSKKEYIKLMDIDNDKNKYLKFNEKKWEYHFSTTPKIEYEITFKDNKSIRQPDYDWFITNISNPKSIKKVAFSYMVNYSSNLNDPSRETLYKSLHAYIILNEDSAYISVDGKLLEDEVYKMNSDIRNILESGGDRYDKTIKNRNIRIQSFCFSIGTVLSYILYLILLVNKNSLPEVFNTILTDKYAIVFGQWLVSGILGNIFGFWYMMRLYKELIPQKRYSHYNSSSRSNVYIDDVEDYISHDEVQIGKYTSAKKNRELIEKIFKITNIVVLVQVIISVILFLILK